jgi:putative tryptophan/tyrosine transport system substrate-binding protein
MAAGIPAALAAKAATTTIPIVFEIADDPVEIGLVASLNRPGGNLTGVTTLNVELAPKRLELLHEVVPTTRSIALLVDAGNPVNERLSTDTQTAAQTLGLHLHVLHARTERDFDTVFASTVQMQVGALVINNGPLFLSRVEQVAALTPCGARDLRISRVHRGRRPDELWRRSYRSVPSDRRELSRILKGERPANLPVQQATKVELFINLKTAKALGLTVPQSLRATADDVIE